MCYLLGRWLGRPGGRFDCKRWPEGSEHTQDLVKSAELGPGGGATVRQGDPLPKSMFLSRLLREVARFWYRRTMTSMVVEA